MNVGFLKQLIHCDYETIHSKLLNSGAMYNFSSNREFGSFSDPAALNSNMKLFAPMMYLLVNSIYF